MRQQAPVSMYVTKLLSTTAPSRRARRFASWSPTSRWGLGKKKDFYVKKVQCTLLMMGCYVEQIADCLVGIDQFLLKSGTLTMSATMHHFVVSKVWPICICSEYSGKFFFFVCSLPTTCTPSHWTGTADESDNLLGSLDIADSGKSVQLGAKSTPVMVTLASFEPCRTLFINE